MDQYFFPPCSFVRSQLLLKTETPVEPRQRHVNSPHLTHLRHFLPLACHIPTQELLIILLSTGRSRIILMRGGISLLHTCLQPTYLPLQLNIYSSPFGFRLGEMAEQCTSFRPMVIKQDELLLFIVKRPRLSPLSPSLPPTQVRPKMGNLMKPNHIKMNQPLRSSLPAGPGLGEGRRGKINRSSEFNREAT